MEKIDVNGISLAYRSHGHLAQTRTSIHPYPTTGAPLILVHGFPLDGSVWETLAERLADQFDVFMPDLRGFGGSGVGTEDPTVEQMAADLAGFTDLMGMEQVFIAGHSMGGYVTLAFARLYPQKVLGLGLIGSQAVADTPERQAGRLETAGKVALEGAQVVAGMAEKLTASPLQYASALREVILRQPPAGLIGGLKAMAARPDVSTSLPDFHFPVALVHGLVDALIPPERSREMKALLPQASLLELPDIGHSPFLEAVEETAGAILGLTPATS